MAEDWPSPHHHEPHPLPRIEDLPAAWEGYDRERVQAAFDAFYRHIAQLDATLRALESVDVFRQQAGDLRAELRSLRSAGWAPYPRGYTLTPERSMLGSVPESVPRIALEVVFLIIVAAVVAVAKFSTLEIAAVMAGAVLITFLVELIAARERQVETPIPAAAPPAPVRTSAAPAEVKRPEPAVVSQESTADGEPVAVTTDELLPEESVEEEAAADDGSGWAAFAEPAGQPLTAMGGLAGEEPPDIAEPGPEAPAEPEPEPAAEIDEETGVVAPRRRLRRRRHEEEPHEDEAAVPKHVRVLPPPETAVAEAELPPWERGFDDTEERR